jgi:hypothetical protein
MTFFVPKAGPGSYPGFFFVRNRLPGALWGETIITHNYVVPQDRRAFIFFYIYISKKSR